MFPGKSICIIALDQPNKSCPAADYIDELPDEEQMPILTLLQRIGAHGRSVNPQRFKQLKSAKIWEIRSYQHRIFCFFGRTQPDGRETLVLVNAYRKKEQRTKEPEIAKAQAFKKVYLGG